MSIYEYSPMLRSAFILTLMLTGCANSAVPRYDPNSDAHCHALGVYFERDSILEFNKKEKIDAGIVSIIVVAEWYRSKWLEQAAKGSDPAAIAQIYKQIGVDFDFSKRTWIECSNRATNDRAFEFFAREMASEMTSAEWWKGLNR